MSTIKVVCVRDEITPHLERLIRTFESAETRRTIVAALNREMQNVDQELRRMATLRPIKWPHMQQVVWPPGVPPPQGTHRPPIPPRPAFPCIPGEHLYLAARERLDRVFRAQVERLLKK